MKRIGRLLDCKVYFLVVAAVVIAGCRGENGDKESPGANAEIEMNQEATSVAASKPGNESSPAQVSTTLPSRDAPPNEVCQKFVELLQAGDRLAAENLLTRSALAVTGRAELELEPLGGPQARYQMSTPMYATNKQQLAQVRCTVADVNDGGASESSFSWMVRKQKEGWRISGIMIQLEDGQPEDFLSFENYADVVKIKTSLAGEKIANQRQADSGGASQLK